MELDDGKRLDCGGALTYVPASRPRGWLLLFDVPAGAADQLVAPAAALQRVAAGSAQQLVRRRTAAEKVVSAPAVDLVAVRAATQAVVEVAAGDGVEAEPTVEDVDVTRSADELVVGVFGRVAHRGDSVDLDRPLAAAEAIGELREVVEGGHRRRSFDSSQVAAVDRTVVDESAADGDLAVARAARDDLSLAAINREHTVGEGAKGIRPHRHEHRDCQRERRADQRPAD